jgi:hypothetical protein
VLTTLPVNGVSDDGAVTLPVRAPARIQRDGLDVAVTQQLDPAYRTVPVTFGVPPPPARCCRSPCT